MMTELEQQIRERAYQLWQLDGCKEGEADLYWISAEREVLSTFAATQTVSKPSTAAAAAKKSARTALPAKRASGGRRRTS